MQTLSLQLKQIHAFSEKINIPQSLKKDIDESYCQFCIMSRKIKSELKQLEQLKGDKEQLEYDMEQIEKDKEQLKEENQQLLQRLQEVLAKTGNIRIIDHTVYSSKKNISRCGLS